MAIKKHDGRERISSIPMDFGGRLVLQKNMRWIYVQGSGSNKIVKSTFHKDFEKARQMAKQIRKQTNQNYTCKVDFIGEKESLIYSGLYRSAKKNAKKRGIEWELTNEDMKTLISRSEGCCELTGIKFQKNLNYKKGSKATI